MTLTKIISGGQTGADQGALHGARLAGLETGGAAPSGYRTEDGEAPTLLRSYGLGETVSSSYPPRTRVNVMNSDGTLIFGDLLSTGSGLTSRICFNFHKPSYEISWRNSKIELSTLLFTVQWIRKYNIKTLNVAGNRESRNPGIHEATSQFVVNLVKELRKVAR